MPTKYRRYTLYTKLRVLEAARNGLDWEAVAEENNVNISTARNWSAVKDYMTEHRADILAVPEGVTMKAHRQFHLTRAARSKFPEVATPGLCEACYRHTLTFHVKVTDLEDMPVGR
ncbi:hypothetical protein PInf_008679 [Phytophthora infestans]|nr:hypothetical protein PInf_008665 [Phytophthora infestans]KAI9982689.1 hypothetical protein PInf_008676 [Phytophthora infestans]KAI9982691.1 hypothetical protein PInf_008679 [Phytophthora infestans]